MDFLYFDELRWRKFLVDFNAKEEQSQWTWFSKVLDIENQRTSILKLAQRMSTGNDCALPQNSSTSPLLHNLKFIYGNTYGSNWGVVKAYRDTREKIVEQYVCIRGMEQLFDEIYFQFEWNMHVTPDFVKGNESLYRDHFLHQSKNAWMGYEFLQRIGWMQYCVEWLNGAQNKKIAMYVNKAIQEEMIRQKTADTATIDHPLDKLLSIYVRALNQKTSGLLDGETREITKTVLCEAIEWNRAGFTFKEKKEAVLRALVRFNLIKTTWFIATLLHDIGYPLSHFHTNLKQIAHFIPSMEWQDPTDIRSFEHYKCRLKNSLLFKVIHEDTLKDEFTKNIHGTLSAIMMLNHFYEQGTVHTFSPLQQCAVDWAAVCIQQHTQKFQASTLNPKEKYSMDRVSNNPLGYLLRLVDDLQEYGRFYFQIDGFHTVMFCSKCGYPMKSKSGLAESHDARSNGEDLLAQMDLDYLGDGEVLEHSCFNKNPIRRYYCACSENESTDLAGNDVPHQARQILQCRTFDSRRINTIRFCNQVAVMFDKSLGKIVRIGEPVRITLRYDLWAMLELTRMNPRFLQARIAPNNEIKRMLLRQSELPRYMLYFMISVNPVLLKTEILYEYILNHYLDEWETIRQSIEKMMQEVLKCFSLSEDIRNSIGSYASIQSQDETSSKIEKMIDQLTDADGVSGLKQCRDLIHRALGEKDLMTFQKEHYEKLLKATKETEEKIMENAVHACFKNILQSIKDISQKIVEKEVTKGVTFENYKDIETAALVNNAQDDGHNLDLERGKRMAFLTQFFYAPILVLYAYAYWWIKIDRKPIAGGLLTESKVFRDSLDKSIKKCYNEYISLLKQRINAINGHDNGQHSDQSEEVYFLMRDVLRYRKCIAYHLMNLHNIYSGEEIIAKDDKTYLHSFESCTDPEIALEDDQKALAYQEKLIQSVQHYTEMNGYDPSLIYAKGMGGKRNRRYLVADFYGDLRLFYDLYTNNNRIEMKADKKAFDSSRCVTPVSTSREV